MTDEDLEYCPECGEEIDPFDSYFSFCDSDCYDDYESAFEDEEEGDYT